MASPEPPAVVRFTLNGLRYELSRAQVDERLAGAIPDAIQKHALRINGTWYPVRQAFAVATGLPRTEFTSHIARRHLAALGYELHGEIEQRNAGPAQTPTGRVAQEIERAGADDESWHTEANVQAAVVTALIEAGWSIVSVANTATKEHGIDIVASRGEEAVGVEVKGYPSRGYADPARAGEIKKTQPSTQAVHWYAQALLAAMRLRTKRPELRSVMALPDFSRYRDLYAETAASLEASSIEVWWVSSSGALAGSRS
jgi:Holliday junction resolvase-like predicted endonuclease